MMAINHKLVEIVRQSYVRCYQNDQFFKLFYGDFLKQSDDIAVLFKETNWNKQIHLIKSAVRSAIMFAGNPDIPVARKHIESIARLHSHSHLNIKPDFYPIWLESMIRTLKECDPHFSSKLEEAWRKVLGATIDLMISRYDSE